MSSNIQEKYCTDSVCEFPDALYDWITKGSNVGVQADVGLGPLSLSSNAGFETKSYQPFGQIGGRIDQF